MTLLQNVQTQIVVAMKAKDELRLTTLRSIKAALDKFVKEGKTLDEAAENKILEALAKQRRESSEMFLTGNRPELFAKEQEELKIIMSFLPADANEVEVDAAITSAIETTGATTIKQMGAVLAAVRSTLSGKRVDGAVLSTKVKARLGL